MSWIIEKKIKIVTDCLTFSNVESSNAQNIPNDFEPKKKQQLEDCPLTT